MDHSVRHVGFQPSCADVVSGARPTSGNGGGARLRWTPGSSALARVSSSNKSRPLCVDAEGGRPRWIVGERRVLRRVTEALGCGCTSAHAEDGGAGIGLEAAHRIAGGLICSSTWRSSRATTSSRIGRRVYRPQSTIPQCWHEEGLAEAQLRGHDFYFTVGQHIGTVGCDIPTGGMEWRPILQPVVLDDWEVAPAAEPWRFTTVSSWRGPFGPVTWGGVQFGVKAHEFRKFATLPPHDRRSRLRPCILAIGRRLLARHRWTIVDPRMAVPIRGFSPLRAASR